MASIQPRKRADGSTTYRVMFRLDGTQASDTFPSAKAADDFARLVTQVGGSAAREILAARNTDRPVVVLADWLEDHINRLTGVTDGTRRGYRSIAKRHINPTLGQLPLEALDRRRLEKWVNDLTPQMAGKTLRNVHALLSAALGRAVYDGLVPANLAEGVRLPASDHNRTEMVTLTPNEFTLLLGCFAEHWQPFIATLVGTGMRWGEATALTVGAVDLDAQPPTVRVQQAWKRTGKSARELGAPKTRRGRRTISIGPALARTLRPLVEGRPADAYVFTALEGGIIHHGTFHPRVWQPAVKATQKAGLTKTPRIHDLRHTYATWMAARIPLDQLQRLLGHESIQTTVDVYGHARPGDAAAAALAIEEALGGALPEVLAGLVGGQELVQVDDDVLWDKPRLED